MAAKKYFLDEKGERYFINMYDGTSNRVIHLSRYFKVPRHTIHDWAKKLGVSRPTRRHWSDEETLLLSSQWGKKSVKEIARALNRTDQSVRVKSTVLGISKSKGMNAAELCEAFGCYHTTIDRWIREGMIKGTQITKASPWQFSNKQIRAFVISYPGEIDQRRVNFIWLVDLLSRNAE